MIEFLKLLKVFGSQIKTIEILRLLNDEKKVVRHLFEQSDLIAVKEFCLSNNLHLEESTFKVIFLDLHKKFSNKGIIVNRNDSRKGRIAVYISKDEILSLQAKYYELTEDHLNLGHILGYPQCCIDFFIRENPVRKNLDNDYLSPGLKKSKEMGFSFYLNYFLRDEDIALLSHFPCNYTCSKSLSIAKKTFNLLSIFNPLLAKEFEEKLKQKAVFDGREIRFN